MEVTHCGSPRTKDPRPPPIPGIVLLSLGFVGKRAEGGTLDLTWTDRGERQKSHPRGDGDSCSHWPPASFPTLSVLGDQMANQGQSPPHPPAIPILDCPLRVRLVEFSPGHFLAVWLWTCHLFPSLSGDGHCVVWRGGSRWEAAKVWAW